MLYSYDEKKNYVTRQLILKLNASGLNLPV
jgi:hypothetical protein